MPKPPGARSGERGGFGQSLLQSVAVINDGAKEADFAFGTGLSDGNGDRVLVDIETEIECNRLHGLVVSSDSHDESERIASPQ